MTRKLILIVAFAALYSQFSPLNPIQAQTIKGHSVMQGELLAQDDSGLLNSQCP